MVYFFRSVMTKQLKKKTNTSLKTNVRAVFAEINVPPPIRNKCSPKQMIFQRGGVHKTDGFWWVSFQRGEYTKPMGFDGWLSKEGSTQNRWLLEFFLLLLKIKRSGRLFRQIRYVDVEEDKIRQWDKINGDEWPFPFRAQSLTL